MKKVFKRNFHGYYKKIIVMKSRVCEQMIRNKNKKLTGQ